MCHDFRCRDVTVSATTSRNDSQTPPHTDRIITDNFFALSYRKAHPSSTQLPRTYVHGSLRDQIFFAYLSNWDIRASGSGVDLQRAALTTLLLRLSSVDSF